MIIIGGLNDVNWSFVSEIKVSFEIVFGSVCEVFSDLATSFNFS